MDKKKIKFDLSGYDFFLIYSNTNIFKLVSRLSEIFNTFLTYDDSYDLFSDEENDIFFKTFFSKEKKYKNLKFWLAISRKKSDESISSLLSEEKSILYLYKITETKERKKVEKWLFSD